MRFLALLALLPCLLEAQAVAERIQALERRHPAIARAFWGAKVVDLETGGTVYEYNARRLFIPASNTKLFSTALALSRLGPDHRFLTFVTADKEPDAEGVLAGDLRIAGGGDPTLSARGVPYQKGPIRGDPLAGLEELADLLAATRLRTIQGDIVGDDSAYVFEPYPPGWATDDVTWDYGAPVSALTLHDNTFRVTVRAAYRAGEPALLTVAPPLDYYILENRIQTVADAPDGVSVTWPPGSRQIQLWGAIRRNQARDLYLAIRDPAAYTASVFAAILRRRGIAIQGEPKAKHRWLHEVQDLKKAALPPALEGVELARRTSPPLFEILKIVNKVSQNLHAEIVLRETGRVRRNIGSRAAGLEELQLFLRGIGIAPEEYHFEDGSGLSRLNLVSPEAVTKLLTHMYLSADRDGWLDMLPIGGDDGTLSHRFRGAGISGRVLAKTGTLTHVSALAGYLEPSSGSRLAFSVLVNNCDAPAAVTRRFIDELIALLVG
jgi:D-alanyl-D-alanine carboxypeptidase/D-alanyl-D-alanine-endopeptidase (penicillin-binding protein 4)